MNIRIVSCCLNCLLAFDSLRCEKDEHEIDADEICEWYEPDYNRRPELEEQQQ